MIGIGNIDSFIFSIYLINGLQNLWSQEQPITTGEFKKIKLKKKDITESSELNVIEKSFY